MFRLDAELQVYLHRDAIGFRAGINSLGILDSLEARNRQAIDAKLSYVDFLALLFETPLPVVSEERASFGRQMVAHGEPITGTAAARMRSH